MFYASGQARGLPPVADDDDEDMTPRPAARRVAGADRLNAFRAAIGAAARGSGTARPAARPAAASRPRVVAEQKKGRGTFTYSRD
jgi:predicted lipoprotein with Yx(FWY)xxD motif